MGRPTPQVRWQALIGAIVLLIAGVVWYRAREQGRWTDYFDSLKKQPGLVITAVDKRSGVWIVDGLKDPLVKSPVHDGVRFQWQPFLSLDPAFAQQREFENIKGQLEWQLIRFDAGSAKLQASEVRRIDEASAAIGKLLQLRPDTSFAVTGRADDVCSEETNNKLSLARANQVRDALILQGLPKERLLPSGLGKAQPLRKGASDWDRAANRSVIFQVTHP